MMRSLHYCASFLLLFWISLNQSTSASLNNIVPFKTSIEIGHCDDLVLDARRYYNFGGTNDSNYIWYIHQLHQEWHGVTTIISKKDLTELSNIFIVQLNIKYFKSSSIYSTNITVHKSEADIISNIKLHAINEYSSNIYTLLNGNIDIYSSISFESNNDQCSDNTQISLNDNEYELHWFVDIESQHEKVIIDEHIYSALNTYLSSQNSINANSLSIDTKRMLQSGMNYQFIMNIKYDAYNDGINTTHHLMYKHSDIQCQIMGGDVILDTLSPLQMRLNGALFTYDNDDDVGLQFNWKCIDDNAYNSNCNHILDSTDLSIINANFSLSSSNGTIYGYTFILNVHDNMYRDNCSDSITFIADNDYDDDEPYGLIISTTAISNRISEYDKVRIIASITNKEIHNIYQYRWFEVNALLSDDDIISNDETSHDSFNLVLRSNTLTPGITYRFRLEVYRYNEDILIEHGASGITEVYVMNGADIMDDSFIIVPECNHIMYDSINAYMEHDRIYSVSVVASGNYTPFLYGFKYGDHHFHPNLLSTPFIDDIYLPIGDNILSVDVYDAESTLAIATIQCEVILNDYTQCIENSDELFDDIDLFITDYDKYMYILQKSNVYLQYILDHKLSDTKCIKEILSVILTAFNDYIPLGAFCHSNFVILLSEVMTLWIDAAVSDQSLIVLFYKDKISMIRNAVLNVLDPCLYIKTYIGVENMEYLTVSTDSMIRNVPKIYYNDDDITSNLSIIQVNDRYHDLLYTLTYSLIKVINIVNDRQMYNLLSSSLYIASLSSISTSIPGEEININFDSFSIFSTKISNDNNYNDITVSVHNITVYIPHDIFLSSSLTEAIDIVIVGIETNESQVTISSNKRCTGHGSVSKDAVSITTIGNHTNPHNLSSNIILEFACTDCDDDYRCMWYNPLNQVWDDNGCDTLINNENNSIICSCSHLTTFTTIHNIHQACDLFSFKYWNIINFCYGSLFICTAIYISFEIYPFFIDAHLTYKQMSVLVMSILFVICILHFIACIAFHHLQYNGFDTVTINMLTAFLLLSMHFHFIVYCLILFTWFTLAHAMMPDIWRWKRRAKLVLIIANIIILLFSLVIYIFSITTRDSDEMEHIFITVEIIWSSMLSIACIIFIGYAIGVAKILITTFIRTSVAQRHAERDLSVAKKTMLINFFITLFFVTQSILSVYYTIHSKQFTLIPRIIDQSVTLLFIILLCVMYRKAMKRLIASEAKHKYKLCNRMLNKFKKTDVAPRLRSQSILNTTNTRARARSNAALGTQTTVDIGLPKHRSHTSYTQSVTVSHRPQRSATCSFYAESTAPLNAGLREEEDEDIDYDEVPDVTLEQCLEHDRGYQFFLNHCKKQYCGDVVLAVVEFIQFQNYYNLHSHAVKIPNTLSISSIVKDDKLSMRQKILDLCNKYIVNGSEFQLNVGGSIKSDILKAMPVLDRMQDEKCAVIFNDCVFAIVALMHDSFIGFQSTSGYQEMKMSIWTQRRITERIKGDMTLTPSFGRYKTVPISKLAIGHLPINTMSFTPTTSLSPTPTSGPRATSNTSNVKISSFRALPSIELPPLSSESSPIPPSKQQSKVSLSSPQYLSIEEARAMKASHKVKKEQLLNDKDFVSVFGMTKNEFSKLKGWRQKMLKKQKGLF